LDGHPGWKGSRRNAIVAVKRMYNWCVDQKLLAENPIKGVKKPRKKRRTRILSVGEKALLLAAVTDRYFGEFCFAMLETGARPMEVAGVTANDVSRDCTRWTLDEHKTDRTGEARVIYLTPAMRELTARSRHSTGHWWQTNVARHKL
jgi:integrase